MSVMHKYFKTDDCVVVVPANFCPVAPASLTQAPEHGGCDRPLRPARGQLVGLEERRRRAPGPVYRQGLRCVQQLP